MNYAELGLTPVNDDNPAGTDVRYEDFYNELQAEIDKLNSPALFANFDWNNVIGPASLILKSHSKDLLVASYLSIALLNSKGAEGLEASAGLMGNLLSNFWDTLYPLKKRAKGRISALEYWIDHTHQYLDSNKLEELKADSADGILKNYRDIEELLQEKKDELKLVSIEDHFQLPGIINLVTGLKEKPDEDNADAETVQKESSASGDNNTVESVDYSDAELSSPADAYDVIKKNFQQVKLLLKHMRDRNPEDPRPYRWARVFVWDTIDVIPPSEDGKSKIPPPPKGALSSLKALYESGKWKELLENAEIKITNSGYMFCFDLTMYTAEALMNLGESYELAGKALRQEMLFLISRHPSIIEGAFSDGTPFAGSETQEWIKTIGADSEPVLQVGSEPVSIGIAGSDINEEIQEAMTLSRDKSKLKEAVYSLQSNLNGSSSGKDSFLRRIGLAELLYSKNKMAAAMPHAEMIMNDIDKFSLDKWQPELALRGLKTALKVFRGLKDNKEKNNLILKKISLLDATEVLEV